jgi:RpiR family transcriptional regulator, carbohydrate utilization regulator
MLSRIEQLLPKLSKAEQRVAEWVLAHPRQAAGATLAVVAEAAGASEPSVIRFCRRIGLKGFRELTLRLTEALSRPASYIHRDVDASDAVPDAVNKVLDASIQALLDARALLAIMPLEAAIAAMQDARQLVFAGLGASGHVAADACHKFFRLGLPCSVLNDGPSITQFAAIATTGDVLLLISANGAWQETALAAESAKKRGATVIALTDPLSRLAAAASLVLPAERIEDTSVYTPMSSRLTHLAVLDALLVSLALSMGEQASGNLRASKDAISVQFAG